MRARFLGIAFCAAPLLAAPLIRDIHPHGAQKGTAVQLSVRGEGLGPDSKVQTSIPGVVSRLVVNGPSEKPNSELAFLVEVGKYSRPGLYPIRVIGAEGL